MSFQSRILVLLLSTNALTYPALPSSIFGMVHVLITTGINIVYHRFLITLGHVRLGYIK